MIAFGGTLAGRFTHELVGICRAEIDLLTLWNQFALILYIEHRLRCAIRH